MKILVIVDAQNDFVSGVLGSKEADMAMNRLTEYINECSSEYGQNMLVLLTKDTHSSNYLKTMEGKYLPVEHCIEGTSGWSIDDRISKAIKAANFCLYSASDIRQSRILKPTFGSTQLAEILKEVCGEFFVEEIIFTGVCTDICVISNVMLAKAFCPNTKICVKEDCCAGVTPEKHQAAIDVMKSCQIDII